MASIVDELDQKKKNGMNVKGCSSEMNQYVLGAPKDFVKEAQSIILVLRLGFGTAFAQDTRHVFLGEESPSFGVFASGKREKFLDEWDVFRGLVGL